MRMMLQNPSSSRSRSSLGPRNRWGMPLSKATLELGGECIVSTVIPYFAYFSRIDVSRSTVHSVQCSAGVTSTCSTPS